MSNFGTETEASNEWNEGLWNVRVINNEKKRRKENTRKKQRERERVG